MIHKAAIVFFTAFVVTVVLLVAFDSSAFAQVDRSRSVRLSPEAASKAEALFKNALLSFDNQESESARLQLQEAMVQNREPGKAAKAALQLGDRYKQVWKYPEALNCYRQALDIKSLPAAARANALNAIAIIYAELYAHDLAERYFKLALDQGRKVSDFQAQIPALTGLAELCHQRREFEKALNLTTTALLLVKKSHAEADPDLMYLRGRASLELGAVGNAKDALVDSLLIYRNTGNVAGQVGVLCTMSSLSLLTGQKQAALEQAEQAVKLAEEQAKAAASHADDVNARGLRWRPFISRARAERALGQRKLALTSYGSAIHHFVGVWWAVHIATEASAVAFREESQAAYREYVDLLMEDAQFKNAYDLAEEAKGRTLLTFTAARRARPGSGDSQHAATQLDLSRSIASLHTQLRASGRYRKKQAKLQKELEDAEFKMEETLLEAELGHFRERWVWSPLANADPLQKRTADEQMTLAQFSFGEKRSFVWLFANGDFSFEYLPGREEIEKAVRQYLDILAAPPSRLYIERDLKRVREQSEALFARLFGGLSSQIKPGRRLIIVPDGLLGYLPFETLIHNGRFLVQDHEISYLPSASRLMQPQASRREAGTEDRMELLAFGDPIFGQAVKAFVTKNSTSGRSFQLAELPRTRDEVQNIAKLFPPDRTRLYLGKDSTEDAVKRESLRRYRRLHFATHSLIDETSPYRSAVVLTQDADPDEDGFLEVSEIPGLDLDCDLVVLSACQTGRGQLLSGEGIVGLSRAFLYAGARAVVVSLWNVSDISTGQLMESFYRHLTAGIGNAAALRETKLQMLESRNETRHPYYWSPFVIIGKP